MCKYINKLASRKTQINELKTMLASKLGLSLNNKTNNGNYILKQDYNTFTHDILSTARAKFPNQNVIIDDGKLIFASKQNLQIQLTNTYVFTESNSLLSMSPSGLFVEVKTFLRPNIKINDNVFIDKKVNHSKNYNGTYIVCGLKHSCKISYVSTELNSSMFQLKKV